MKLTFIISPDTAEEEIIIKCREKNEKIIQLERAIDSVLTESTLLTLYIRDTEYYVPKRDILYFETEDGRVKAHTAERIYTTEYKLFELEKIMPQSFVRVSKSCILNIDTVEAIKRNPLGASEVYLKGSAKKVYVSRSYYKMLKEKIEEMRIKR